MSNAIQELARRARVARQGRVCGRYAPSPTGPLHLGNVRTALLSWLHIRLQRGVFLVRMEDVDELRAVDGAAEQILEDLTWLGLDWDEGPDVGGDFGSYTQSERQDLYEDALEALSERVYPCYCSRKDIREAASAPHGMKGHMVYPGTCRELTPEGRIARRQERGLEPAFRYRVTEQDVTFEDVLMGSVSQNVEQLVGDFIIKRRDGLFAYQLAVVVDDACMGVTDVLRGEDLLESTPRQIALFRAFGVEIPRFAHVPLMRDAQGNKLSKRDDASSLGELRRSGWSAPKVVGMLAASLNMVPEGTEIEAAALLAQLDLETFLAKCAP